MKLKNAPNYVLILSRYLIDETGDVLRRPRIRSKWHVADELANTYCERLAVLGEDVSPTPLPPVIRDRKDQGVIETAVAGHASIICTLDAHFFEDSIRLFLSARGISVVTDVELLRMLRRTDLE